MDAQARSEARALAVAKALVKAGVDCKRVLPVGFGASKPAFEDASKNTRMVFENAALRGHAIGGMPVDGGGKVAGDPCAP
jgi:OOP family OmpA-OmpF porin